MCRIILISGLCLYFVGCQFALCETRTELEYATAPVDNPLKGLVPYQGDRRQFFPHSMEFNYIRYSDLVHGYQLFDWKPLEKMLNDIASRGHQAVVRVYLEYPNKTGAIPQFLLDDGLKLHKYTTDNGRTISETPDYEDRNLRRSLRNFIAAFGRKYDGDPRLAFMTAGLLGAWGEWHTYPKEELFASKEVQKEVMDAYEKAFRTTAVLLRYPASSTHPQYAMNAERHFGYHDDSFAWATLHTGKKGDEWFYMTTLKAAGTAAESKWKTKPIGGEIRPEAWGKVFDELPGTNKIQNFHQCVETTHATWLMDSGMFRKNQPQERIDRALKQVQRLGYEFYCPVVTISEVSNNTLEVSLEIVNRGVAPFYYDWRAQWGLLHDGKEVKLFPASGKLTGLLPSEPTRVWKNTLDLAGIDAGTYKLALRVPNPMKGGKPVRFANRTQQLDGWLLLDNIQIK
ncbi:MAG: DUF4832 domain-containing protein [Zavarzinella sp.]